MRNPEPLEEARSTPARALPFASGTIGRPSLRGRPGPPERNDHESRPARSRSFRRRGARHEPGLPGPRRNLPGSRGPRPPARGEPQPRIARSLRARTGHAGPRAPRARDPRPLLAWLASRPVDPERWRLRSEDRRLRPRAPARQVADLVGVQLRPVPRPQGEDPHPDRLHRVGHLLRRWTEWRPGVRHAPAQPGAGPEARRAAPPRHAEEREEPGAPRLLDDR